MAKLIILYQYALHSKDFVTLPHSRNSTHLGQVSSATELLFQIDGPKQFGVNLKLLQHNGVPINISHFYRPGYYFLRQKVQAGVYILVASNYEKAAGPFFLHTSSSGCDPVLALQG